MTLQQVIRETQQLNKQEFQTLFLHMFHQAKKRNQQFDFLDNVNIQIQKKSTKKKSPQKRTLGSLQHINHTISKDFDAPLPELNDYM